MEVQISASRELRENVLDAAACLYKLGDQELFGQK